MYHCHGHPGCCPHPHLFHAPRLRGERDRDREWRPWRLCFLSRPRSLSFSRRRGSSSSSSVSASSACARFPCCRRRRPPPSPPRLRERPSRLGSRLHLSWSSQSRGGGGSGSRVGDTPGLDGAFSRMHASTCAGAAGSAGALGSASRGARAWVTRCRMSSTGRRRSSASARAAGPPGGAGSARLVGRRPSSRDSRRWRSSRSRRCSPSARAFSSSTRRSSASCSRRLSSCRWRRRRSSLRSRRCSFAACVRGRGQMGRMGSQGALRVTHT